MWNKKKEPTSPTVVQQVDALLPKSEIKPLSPFSIQFLVSQVAFSSVANILGTVAGHPLDTVRVRMQLTVGQTSTMQIMRETYRGEGVPGFFKGMVSPLVGVTPYNVMCFTITEMAKSYLPESISQQKKAFYGGALAGGVSLVVYNPVELLKVRAQSNRTEFTRYRKAIPLLIEREGCMGLYKGFGALWWRDVPGWAVYFWSYEVLKDWTGYNKRSSSDQKTWLDVATQMWAGGTAGQISWILSYPFDIIKTHIQCTESKIMTMREVIQDRYQAEGLKHFWKGFSATVARSFICNAIALPMFDELNTRYSPLNNRE